MRSLIRQFIPNAPKLGLYVEPNIPDDKLGNAIRDYAGRAPAEEVVALFDATLIGSGKDGAVFLQDRLIYQNSDLEPAQEIRYDDIVNVDTKRRLLGGKQVLLEVNSANATVEHKLDFSGRPQAAEFVATFFREVMLHPLSGEKRESDESGSRTAAAKTNVRVVRRALDVLRAAGDLTDDDYRRLLETLGGA